MPCKLVDLISLENVGAILDKVNKDSQLACMGGEMQTAPIVSAAR
mgnify:CR=1 FL=1